MYKKYLILVMLLAGYFSLAQEHFPKNDGVSSKNTNYTAFTNAKSVMKTAASVTAPKRKKDRLFSLPSESLSPGT